jgi:hypothetical protein
VAEQRLGLDDNGGPFRSHTIATFIASPGPSSRTSGSRFAHPARTACGSGRFQPLKYEGPYLAEIAIRLELVPIAETFRVEFNKFRPHEHLSWNFP